jgi:hypothetical protein
VRVDLRIAGVALVGALLGFAVHGWLRPGRPAADAPASRTTAPSDDLRERVEALVSEIAELRSTLDGERSRRGALELEMALLHRELGAAASPSADASEVAAPGSQPAGEAERGDDPAAAPAGARHAAEANQRDWFDAAALRQQGIDERHTEWLRERFEELQMEELYLRDQATREGWIGRPRYHAQMQAARKQARESLGIEDYDLLLYASGRNNRVQIRDVLQSSPAAAGGIESGDVVLRYDDATVLDPADLTTATSQGKPGSSVTVDVLRDGAVRRFYLPRGPLGVQIIGVRRFPSPES